MAQSFGRMQPSLNSNDNDFPALSTFPPTPSNNSPFSSSQQPSSYSQVGINSPNNTNGGVGGGMLSPGPGGIATREFASEFPNLNAGSNSGQRVVSGGNTNGSGIPSQGFMSELDKRSAFQQKQNNLGGAQNSQWTPSMSGILPPPPLAMNSNNNQLFDPTRSPSMLPAIQRTGNSPPGVGGVGRAVGAAGSIPATNPNSNNLLPPPSSSSVPLSSGMTPKLPSSTAPSNTTASITTTSTTGGISTVTMPHHQVLFSPADRYGLLGLLHIIKTQDPDLSMLTLGSDLTALGLDLAATDNLYSSFITPWSDSKTALALNIEPEFHLPSCYNVVPPAAQTKIGNFSDETLFFIFYSQPRDSMQEMAAHELYKHNWRYHKELRLWLTKEAGTEPTQKTQSYERGSYIFFDPTLWERVRKDFVLVFEALERKL